MQIRVVWKGTNKEVEYLVGGDDGSSSLISQMDKDLFKAQEI